jgi:hypothetical protein
MIPFLASTVLLGALITIPAFSEVSRQGGKTEGEPQYDPAIVVQVTGTVIRAREVPPTQPLSGLHLLIDSDNAEIDTYLGPIDFLKQFEISFSEGNAVEAIGSRVALGLHMSCWLVRCAKVKCACISATTRDTRLAGRAEPRPTGLHWLERRFRMSGSAQKHHHEWFTYLMIVNILAVLTVFALILLKDCARILTNWPARPW